MTNKNLVWFDKEGGYLNFKYNESSDRFEGDIMFDENSSDTFKTYGLYMFEKIPSFEYELPGDLTLDKFQLFNEFGLHFYGASYSLEQIDHIEPVNTDPNFYSKWIYGKNFESKFPIGTNIVFDSSIMEFNNSNISYVVVSSKKNAIMIISTIDNSTFDTMYYSLYNISSTYTSKTISGVNLVGVYNYIDSLFHNNLSNWSEPNFYDKYYIGKKLNIVNSKKNNNTLKVSNSSIYDILHYEYSLSSIGVPTFSNLIMEVITRTDLPIIYDGPLTIDGNGKIVFSGAIPTILKSGTEFKIVGSTLNTNFLTVSDLPTFINDNTYRYYATQSQVYWNNKIYQSIIGYTQSVTQSITPGSSSYWSPTNYIVSNESTISESLLNCQVYLTKDHLYFEHDWKESKQVTMASLVEKYRDDMKLFNIDLYYLPNKIKSDLKYPSKYMEVNYYYDEILATHSIGSSLVTYEKVVEVDEKISNELNYNLSSNFQYNIVFNDLDEFGFKVIINKMVYQEEIEWVYYTGTIVNPERTIDLTIRNWMARHYVRLATLGILPELRYIGSLSSPYFNSIILNTQYPNVPIDFNVEVGTEASFHIEHSSILFSNLGGYLSININGKSHGIAFESDISTTLSNWVDEYAENLLEYDIIIYNINELLVFNKTKQHTRIDIEISTGKSTLPGEYDYIVNKKIKGNLGCLIASNEVEIPQSSTHSLIDAGFATGMVFSINNTIYPFDNQEYNIQYLDNTQMCLSYQGPFWGLTDSACNSSAYVTLAFSLGFGQTACTIITGPTAGDIGGPFDIFMFDTYDFSLNYNPNTYTINTYDLNSYPGSSNMVYIIYVQISDSIYTLGDSITVMDALNALYISSISLSGNTGGIKMSYNPFNNYLYCLHTISGGTNLVCIDPLLNTIVVTQTMSYTNPIDIEINTTNGDIYLSFDSDQIVRIYDYTNTFITDITIDAINWFDGGARKMVYNTFENCMYVSTTDSSDIVLKIDSSRSIISTYNVSGLSAASNTKLLYESINTSVYVYGSTLNNINNGVVTDNLITDQSFNDLLFNNLTGEIDISDLSTNFKIFDQTSNSYSTHGVSNYGYITLNQYDGDIYLSSLSMNEIIIINSNGDGIYSAPMGAQTTEIIYNPERRSCWAIQPSTNSIIEILVTLESIIEINPSTYSTVGENLYGTLSDDYIQRDNFWLVTRDYIRAPRENIEGEKQVSYYWRWYSDNIPQFFLYDVTGNQLPITGSYAYTGEKPLKNILLNKYSNHDVTKNGDSESQQTIFDRIEYKLEYINDSNDTSTEPSPMELFIGFNSEDEGALRSILQLFKREDVSFVITTNSTNNDILYFSEFSSDSDSYGIIRLDGSSTSNFITNIDDEDRGLKVGQYITLLIKDITNKRKQYISPNNGKIFKIRSISIREIIVDFIGTVDSIYTESTIITNYPKYPNTTYLSTSISVMDYEIGRYNVYGQTDIEDIRFKIELSNVGKNIGSNEIFIFKDYDINEGGIDWIFLNKKRKEMLMMKHLIYSYIGSYKSIINAINYFGYNDLELNEYYRNIDTHSKNYQQLFKVEIPDIFDNTVEGWTDNDFIKHTLPNKKYESTNLFNLTYNITDKTGEKVIIYSLEEVIIKLQGLKYWLQRNIIPLTHKILDITGKSYFNSGFQIQHKVQDISVLNMSHNMTPVSFKMSESYLMPVSSGSTVYNCVIDLNTQTSSVVPDYFNINIRTYKTYKEWNPFTTYSIGDRVSYYGKAYESEIQNNRVENPKKYEKSKNWKINTLYRDTNVVKYLNEIYVFSGTYSVSTISPKMDTNNWLNITKWKEVNFDPVQKLSEFRTIDNLLPYNFTIDSNIDPFVVIEVSSDNGYGLTYTDKKNYEVRGLLDIHDPIKYIDKIGPFTPISEI
jgi:hypothetical protein